MHTNEPETDGFTPKQFEIVSTNLRVVGQTSLSIWDPYAANRVVKTCVAGGITYGSWDGAYTGSTDAETT